MAINKSGWNNNIKVSQKTIDEIKKMGMNKALKTVAGASKASSQDASAKAWVEGVKRLYGANRVAAATKTGVKTTSSSKPVVKSADAARMSAERRVTGMPGKGPAVRVASAKPKASTTSNPFTALHNAVSPYGNKNQTFKSPISSSGASSRKSVPGKPSIGEQINSAIGSVGRALNPPKMTAAQVRAEMKRREAAAKKKTTR